MASKRDETEFVNHVCEMMQGVGPVNAKRMFGGYGIFLEGLMFGLIADSDLYLKADKVTREEFITKGLEPFSYFKREKEFKLSYYQAPEEALENADVMREWGNKAYDVALRAAASKVKKTNRK